MSEARRFHVARVQPRGNPHAGALAELGEYVVAMLGEAGFVATVGADVHGEPTSTTIVVGGHLLGPGDLAALPASTILLNSEPLAEPTATPAPYRAALARHLVWDYSAANLAQVPHARVVPFGFCRALVRSERVRSPGEAIVFHGVLTRRRRRVLAALAAEGVAVRAVVGEYGVPRDVRMMRARAILNLHKSDDASAFQPVRCFYPLINGVPVISEETSDPVAAAFRDAICFVARDGFATTIAAQLRDPAFDREALARTHTFAARSPLPAFRELVSATVSELAARART